MLLFKRAGGIDHDAAVPRPMSSAPSKTVAVAVLLILPLAVAIIVPAWTFLAPTGSIDPYVYSGYFVDLKGTLHNYGPLYYGSRLPWLLIGNAAYAIASPPTADVFLRLLLMYSATFSMYWIVRCIWANDAAALITAGLLGTHTYFIQESGWNYPDGAAICFTLGAMAFLYTAFKSRQWQVPMVLAGLLIVSAFCTQIFLIIVVPPIVLTFLLTQRYFSRINLFDALLYSSTGAVLALFVFGAINVHLGGSFVTVGPQVVAARHADLHAYILPLATWFPHAGWLAFPALALLAALGCGVWFGYRRMWDRGSASPAPQDPALVLISGLQLGLILIIFAIAEWRGGAVLSQVFYGSYLIPFTFIVLGGLLSVVFNREQNTKAMYVCVAVPVLVLTLVPLKWSTLRVLPDCQGGCLDSLATWSVIAGVSGLLIAASISKRLVFAVSALVLLAILNGSLADSTRLFPPDTGVARQRANLIYTVDHFIRADDSAERTLFWYNGSGEYGAVFRGVASLHLWGYKLVSESFPDLRAPSGVGESVHSGSLVAVLSLDDDAITQAKAALRGQGLDADVIKGSWLHEGNQRIRVDVLQVKPAK